MTKEPLFVSFSGGRTSAYMAWWLKAHKSDEYDLRFIFANTGQEHENTLDFVHQCDQEFNLGLIWVEAVVHLSQRKSCTHKIVDYATAARNGEPFREVAPKYGVPNKAFPWCTRELKVNPMKSLKRELVGTTTAKTAVGIRIDEIDRMSVNATKDGLIYPLISMKPTTKDQVITWWSQQSFDLDLPEHYGNCVTCWKKSDRKLMTIAKHEPERFDVFAKLERDFKDHGAGDGNRSMFRSRRTAGEIIASSKEPFNEFTGYTPAAVDISDMDRSDGCDESCEVF